MDLSVIIVNHQTRDHLAECLRSIGDLTGREDREVVVVDNDSADDSVEMLQREFPYVKLIRLDENMGFSRANNIGMKNAKGDNFLLLNSDTKVNDDTLDGMLGRLKKHKGTGALGCRQLDSNGNLQLSFGKFPTFRREIIRKFLHSRLSLNDPVIREYVETKYSTTARVDWVSGSCMAIPRKAAEEAGLFDPDFFMYFEDIDLCRKITGLGLNVYYDPDFTILHHGGITARQNLARSYMEYRRSQFHFCRKYYGSIGLIVLRMFVFFKFLCTAVCSAVFYLVNSFSGERRKKAYSKMLICKKMMEMALRGNVKV